MAEVTEYTDPICSWAWGTEPKLRLLQWRPGHRLSWRVAMGGLVGDAANGGADWGTGFNLGTYNWEWIAQIKVYRLEGKTRGGTAHARR